MSAHIELHFSNDGRVTLTHRPKKGAPVQISEAMIDRDSATEMIGVKAGDNETVTHIISITTIGGRNKGYAA